MTRPYEYTPYVWPMLASPALLLVLAVYAWRHPLALSGGGASLEAHPGFLVVRVEAADRSADPLRDLEPDVVVSDVLRVIEGRMGPKAGRERS